MGRPHIPLLSTDRIIREALALIDAEGADAFSLPRLAARLGIRTPSLYHHVAGRAAVVEGVRRLVVEEMDTSAFADRPWDEALTAWARSYRDAFARHPHAIALLATTTISSPATLAMYETVLGALDRGGWPSERLVAVLTSVEAFLLGSALDLAAPPLMIDPSADGAAVPLLAAALDSVPRKAARAEEAFATGLDALVRGLVAQLAEARA
ncbi:TetR/AcrR family transcriptional regulator C-terminal domain-containing protein [Streptomyces sp. x-80]|jgi:AcrR family transcriptional regulator|uniref:TetR/AcrR family transcriptional regulator C-terminal domain-containing protein n=1 Tax=Streptomyces sp. x-80 TaxID=2789282 RepID=UPI003980E3D6